MGGKREYSNEEAQYALVTSSAPTANDAPIGDNCPVARSVACVLTVILSPDLCEQIIHAVKRFEPRYGVRFDRRPGCAWESMS